MPRHASPYTLTLSLDRVSGSRSLAEAIREEILSGRLRAGTRLPATRELAITYKLARGTVVEAFEQLKSEGYLHGSAGSGTFISEEIPDELFRVDAAATSMRPQPAPNAGFSAYANRIPQSAAFGSRALRAFVPSIPAVDLFPIDLWGKLVTRRARSLSPSDLLSYEPFGYLPLREAIAAYLGPARGVRCLAEQIVIVSGTHEAVDLCIRALLNPADQIVFESPGYVGARNQFVAADIRVYDQSIDGEGMVVPDCTRDAKLAYVTPGHQFPLGITMSLRRRLALLEWARDAKAYIFEDDYDSEFRYRGRPFPALQGMDAGSNVLFAGTFSKTLFPALRIGFLVVPPHTIDTFTALKALSSRHAPVFEQSVLCDFITGGHFSRHLRSMREVYAERIGVLLDQARSRLHGALEVTPIEAGLQTVGMLAGEFDAEAVSFRGRKRGLELDPIETYDSRALLLGFAAVAPTEIRRGIRELAKLLDEMRTK